MKIGSGLIAGSRKNPVVSHQKGFLGNIQEKTATRSPKTPPHGGKKNPARQEIHLAAIRRESTAGDNTVQVGMMEAGQSPKNGACRKSPSCP